LAEDLLLPDFCSGAAGLSGRSMSDFLTGALTPTGQFETFAEILGVARSFLV
jgi:hypothetical protein